MADEILVCIRFLAWEDTLVGQSVDILNTPSILRALLSVACTGQKVTGVIWRNLFLYFWNKKNNQKHNYKKSVHYGQLILRKISKLMSDF